MEARSSVTSDCVQELFDSASNAAIKGLAAYFTPTEWARRLALPLGQYRPVIADLTCGNGQLLKGAAPLETENLKLETAVLLGCDIQTPDPMPRALQARFVGADITRFYAKLRAVDWTCDTYALNPPWDLHWYRAPLAGLAESDCSAVAEAFAAHDGRTSRDTIDSTIATLCLALDRSTRFTEGFLIANEATLQRLMFAPDAPHRALTSHAWAHLVVDGNICMGSAGAPPASSGAPPAFQTGILYFARNHRRGVMWERCLRGGTSYGRDIATEADRVLEDLARRRDQFCDGVAACEYMHTEDTVPLWMAAREEHLRELGLSRKPAFNIWLESGVIRTHLNLFDTASGRVDTSAAAALHALNGRAPLSLVVARSQRKALEDAVRPESPWRVDPALQAAVTGAIAEYARIRAPLYPLPPILRLGFLDEYDGIECARDLRDADGLLRFRAGEHYAVRSTTVRTKRKGTKVNTMGELDAVEWTGQEKAFYLTDCDGVERCFMEARLRSDDVEVNLLRPGTTGRKDKDVRERCPIDFTLQELTEHFIIPDQPDVAIVHAELYQANLAKLTAIEEFLHELAPICANSRQPYTA